MTPPSASAAAPAISPRRPVGPRRAPSAPRRPRRVSGPANPTRNPTRSQTRRLAGRAGPVHAIGLAEAVASHRLLDRLIRGQLWIGVIAFALIGIVTMQLGLLKLNAGIGRSLAHEALLQRENATLSTENSEMAAGERVEAQAEHAGMELIPSGALSFLRANSATDARKAASALSVPVSTSTAAAASVSSGTQSETETSPDGASESTASEATSAAGGSETETASSESSEPAAATSEATGETTSPEATTSASASAESTESGASTEAAAGGAGEATGPSESTSTGGGTTGG